MNAEVVFLETVKDSWTTSDSWAKPYKISPRINNAPGPQSVHRKVSEHYCRRATLP